MQDIFYIVVHLINISFIGFFKMSLMKHPASLQGSANQITVLNNTEELLMSIMVCGKNMTNNISLLFHFKHHLN